MTAAALCAALVVIALATGACSELGNRADATVKIDARDRPEALRLRQELLDQSSTWGGIRIGERTVEQEGDISLTFSLPGKNLDAALGSINHLDAQIDSTDIDVDRTDVDRTATTVATGTSRGTDANASDGQIRLQVLIASKPDTGAGALLRLVMAVFSVIGMVATVLWVRSLWKRRFPKDPPERRRRTIVDISDPPTAETPIVPRDPW